MISIFNKELSAFFSSLIGYIVIGVFLIAMGLFMWVIPDTNLLDYGYASLDSFFSFVPMILLFLIPAVTMRLIAEENQNGTIEFLATKPISDLKIVGGKYLAALALVVFAILPTILYYITIYKLGSPKPGNIDTGAVIGSYLGLVLISAAFISIGLFASSLSKNQIVAFVLGAFLCFFFYLGFEFLSSLPFFYGKLDNLIESLGFNYHYNSLSKGLLDLRDVIYFLSVICFFLFLTLISLQQRKWS